MAPTGRPMALAVLGIGLLLGAAGTTEVLPTEPADYRMDDYRAPTPPTLHGAAVLTTDQAQAHWNRHDAVFIDVLPQPPRPVGLPASTIWRPKPRRMCRAASGCPTPAMGRWRR